MVKFTKLLCVMALFLFGTANANAANKTIALMPGDWANDGATYAAYVWDGIGEAWFPFVEVGNTGTYATQIPDTYTGMLLARLKPSTAGDFKTDNGGLNWDNRWNQSVDYDFTAVANQTMYTFTGNWDNGEGKSLFTTSTIPPAIILRINLQKIIPIANILGISTTNAVTLINTDATVGDLTNEVASLGTSTKSKITELVSNAKEFFTTFDSEASGNLASSFAVAEAALEGTDFDAISGALLALASNVLVYGQSAMGKVGNYLSKMENETIDTDLTAIKTLLSSSDIKSDLPNLIAAIKQLKEDMIPAATTYMSYVNNLINDGTKAGKDVSAVSTAFNNAFATAAAYQGNTATMVEMGKALYDLIKEVEEYKEAQEVPTGINGFTAEKQNDATIYNLNGQRVEKVQKGLYIINGKKVMVK